MIVCFAGVRFERSGVVGFGGELAGDVVVVCLCSVCVYGVCLWSVSAVWRVGVEE